MAGHVLIMDEARIAVVKKTWRCMWNGSPAKKADCEGATTTRIGASMSGANMAHIEKMGSGA